MILVLDFVAFMTVVSLMYQCAESYSVGNMAICTSLILRNGGTEVECVVSWWRHIFNSLVRSDR